MGKDTLIRGSGLQRVLANTVRSPRLNNGVLETNGVEYIFRGGELEKVLEELRRGEFVQIGMGPARNSFYGTRADSYPSSGAVLMDVMTSQVESMRQLPFKSSEATFIVAPNTKSWETRIAQRGALSREEWSGRRDEAKKSISDALEDERYVFILNDNAELASEELRIFATTREYSKKISDIARSAACAILVDLCE